MYTNPIKSFILALALLLGAACAAQKIAAPGDYGKWSRLVGAKISPDGQWASYTLRYEQGTDTLFIAPVTGSKTHAFPLGKNALFSADGKYCTALLPDGLQLINLKTGDRHFYPGISSAVFLNRGRHLLLCQNSVMGQDLAIRELPGGTTTPLGTAREYSVSPSGEAIAFIADDNSVQALRVTDGKKIVLRESGIYTLERLGWSNNGQSIAYLDHGARGTASCGLNLHKDVWKAGLDYRLEESAIATLTGGYGICSSFYYTPFVLSDNASRVMVTLSREVPSGNHPDVIVADARSRLEYSRTPPPVERRLIAWEPSADKMTLVGDGTPRSYFLSPDCRFALDADPLQYEPQDELSAPLDYYLTDLATGERTLLVKSISGKPGTIGFSPDAGYIHYFERGCWWIYSTKQKKRQQLRASASWAGNEEEYADIPSPYALPVWGTDSRHIFLTAENGIWHFDPVTGHGDCITADSTGTNRYKIYTRARDGARTMHFYELNSYYIDLKDGLLLEAYGNEGQTGYFYWTPKGTLHQLAFDNCLFSSVRQSDFGQRFIAVAERADTPQKLVALSAGKAPKPIAATNLHHKDFTATRSGLLHYTDTKGTPLNGVLLYPAGYTAGRQYPMIVHVYERQGFNLHLYRAPTLREPTGFNPAVYTSEGYFVWYPDIRYTIGNPGNAILDCINASLDTVLATGMVDPQRIGIIGHSYGGYEVNYIVSRCTRFRAAVSGAGISDMVSHSLGLDSEGNSQVWRYVNQQMRMGSKLYDDFGGYLQNSPIYFAQNITTPLLSWCGEQDVTVAPSQSIELHMAMRQLSKEHLLLLYKNEGHVLGQPQNQEDLSVRIKDFFAQYLKE
ncbi:MAG: prolyl oligopeptidase family serine peptidase [Bacteroidia bacterium]